MNGNLREVLPDADEAFNSAEVKENSRFEDFSNKLGRGEIPEELEFFSGGRSNVDSLNRQIKSHNLVKGNQDLIEYLVSRCA